MTAVYRYLAHISPHPSTAAPPARASTALRLARVLNAAPATPPRSDRRAPCIHTPWRPLATMRGENYGLDVLLTVWFIVSPVRAGELHPLASCDTMSPRATLESFQRITGQARPALQKGARAALQRAEGLANKAMRCLDVSGIPRERIDDEGEAAVILLQEVLDRIEVPPYPEIPDAKTVRAEKMSRWTLPNTEIEIAKVKEGSREGEWLVSPETLARLSTLALKSCAKIQRIADT